MNRARCLVDGSVWSAGDFAALSEPSVQRLRRELVYVECGAVAYFRHRSYDGRVVCFGSTSHRVGCPEAVGGHQHGPRTIETPLADAGLISISVRTRPQTAIQEDVRPGPRSTDDGGGVGVRSLRTILRHILVEPAFLYSDVELAAPGFPVLPARQFLVRFEQITTATSMRTAATGGR